MPLPPTSPGICDLVHVFVGRIPDSGKKFLVFADINCPLGSLSGEMHPSLPLTPSARIIVSLDWACPMSSTQLRPWQATLILVLTRDLTEGPLLTTRAHRGQTHSCHQEKRTAASYHAYQDSLAWGGEERRRGKDQRRQHSGWRSNSAGNIGGTGALLGLGVSYSRCPCGQLSSIC